MHRRVLADEALAQAALVLEEKVTVVVVVQHAPRQVHEGAQLAQGVAVGLHLAGVVRHPEEDAAAVGGDVAALLDDVEEAASHHLQRNFRYLAQCQKLIGKKERKKKDSFIAVVRAVHLG